MAELYLTVIRTRMSTQRLATILLLLFFTFSVQAEESETTATAPQDSESSGETAASVPKTPPRPRVEPDPFATQLSNLQQNPDPDTEIIQFGEGDTRFPGLYRPYQSENLYGAVLFIVDEDTHFDWEVATHSLRISLSEAGWSTLSLPTLPAINLPIPERTLPVLKVIKPPSPSPEGEEGAADATEAVPETIPQTIPQTTPETASETAASETEEKSSQQVLTSDRKQQAIERGTAAIEWLKTKDIRRVIIAGHGTGATWAAEIALEMQKQVQNVRLMMIDAEQSTDLSAPELMNILPELKITVLDIYSAYPNRNNSLFSSKAEQRKKLAKREKLKFHQVRMPFSSQTPQGQAWLAKRVRGLIDRLIVKAEAERIIDPAKQSKPKSTEQPPGRPKQPI